MTVQELHAQTKDAERRLVDAVKGYKSLAGKCYILQSDGSFLPLSRYILGEGKCRGLLDTGRFMELRRAQQGNVTLYRRGGDGKYFVMPYDCHCNNRQPCTWCDTCDGKSCDGGNFEEFFCRDFQACLDYEADIARAMKDAERYRRELESITA